MEERKLCKNCDKEFRILPDDFEFYNKIEVPPPTWCPDCRQLRRYAWRNERTYYRSTCGLCKKSIVTIYHPDGPFVVYCPTCWWGDGWDASEYGQEYDFNKPFFEQFRELQLKVPRLALLTKNSVNSDYTNHSDGNKNCYLCASVFGGENVLYGSNMVMGTSRDSMECYWIMGGAERCYECIDGEQMYGCQYTFRMKGCNDCLYCFDCNGSSNCFMSYNLRNGQYMIRNEQHSKEEYKDYIDKLNLGSHEVRTKLYDEWFEMMRDKALHKYAIIEKSDNVSGNNVVASMNSRNVFDTNKSEYVNNSTLYVDTKTSADVYHTGMNTELVYETHGVVRSYKTLFSHMCYDDNEIQYGDSCHNSENLFGCVGIKKGKYMIFNKQYEPEQYKELKAKIIDHMKSTGEYGEFFPFSIAPVSFNETQANVYMPLSKEDVLAKGGHWEDNLPGTYGKETLQPQDIPDNIKDVQDDIIKQALKCESCTKNYNIVQPELQLYRLMNLPIPRLCPHCRYMRKIKIRWPRKLWHRQCMCELAHEQHAGSRCPVEFETPYEDSRPEKVYCKQCYETEVV